MIFQLAQSHASDAFSFRRFATFLFISMLTMRATASRRAAIAALFNSLFRMIFSFQASLLLPSCFDAADAAFFD
jgi:hypothetical protein